MLFYFHPGDLSTGELGSICLVIPGVLFVAILIIANQFFTRGGRPDANPLSLNQTDKEKKHTE